MTWLLFTLRTFFIVGMCNQVTSLSCYRCANVETLKGSLDVGSLNAFVFTAQNPHCEYVDGPVNITDCPNDGSQYTCGYFHFAAKVWAHRVEEVEVVIQYRSCMKYNPSYDGTCTGDNKNLRREVDGILPHSVINVDPYGMTCYCTQNGCKPTVDERKIFIGSTFCKSHQYEMNGKCYDWYIPLVITIDGLIVALLATLVSCCCCPCCPLFKKRKHRRESEANIDTSQLKHVYDNKWNTYPHMQNR